MIGKILFLLFGNAFGSLMLLIRNLVVARLITVEDYGIAATFAISMAVVEMASGLGLQQLIVQAREGDDPKLQAGLQGFNVLRGLVSATLLFLLADPIARFLNIPDVAWAYQAMALVPILRGFEHFDIHRLNRDMHFGPLIMTKTLPALIALAAIWPLMQIFQDYRIMLYSILLQWGLIVLTGHLTARRRYALRFDAAIMRRAFGFGWPILISNILLFAMMQGDKLIVGRALGMADLAVYSMGVTLTLTPSLIMAATIQPFFLPRLSQLAEQPHRFEQMAMAVMQAGLACGVVLTVGVFLLGPPFVHLALGPKYQGLAPLLLWLSVASALWLPRVGCTIVALSRAHSSNAMIANAFRIAVLPMAWYVVTHGGTLRHVAWVAIAGEISAYAIAFTLAVRRTGISAKAMTVPIVTFGAILFMATCFAGNADIRHSPATIAFLTAAVMSIYAMTEFRDYFSADFRARKTNA